MPIVELEVISSENGCVRFRIAEQGRKDLSFKASNGIRIETCTLPAWRSSEDKLCLRGSNTNHDREQMLATKADFDLIEEALAEAEVAWAKPEHEPEAVRFRLEGVSVIDIHMNHRATFTTLAQAETAYDKLTCGDWNIYRYAWIPLEEEEPEPTPESKAVAVADNMARYFTLERCYLAALTGLAAVDEPEEDVAEMAWNLADAATKLWREKTAPKTTTDLPF
jgi:hypothetical protein